MSSTMNYANENQDRFLTELTDFLKIPSVSTDDSKMAEVRKAADWLAEAMKKAGIENVKVHDTKRHPIIYGDWLHAGDDKPTVLVYGHYDVQPPEPYELWTTPPFEPDIRDDYIYARGSCDDKGQLYIHVKAAEAYLKSEGRMPVNVKYIFEGEEESGGESLEAFLPANKKLLAADVALISDTSILSAEQPSITYGLRGMCYVLMDVTGPSRDLHSGGFGGSIDNPLNALCHIIAKLKSEEGRILIPGFYDKVRPLSDDERKTLAEYPIDEKIWLEEAGAPALWGEPEYGLAERLGARPTLDVHGIIGGYTGPGAKTVLPSTVHAKVSMRLVPDQDPDEIKKLFTDYVNKITPPTVRVKIEAEHGAPASIVDYNTPAMKAAAHAYGEIFGKEPVYGREGGSIPVVGEFQKHLGLETVLMGFGLNSDQIHSPDERFYLPNFRRGIQTAIVFLKEYANLA